MVLEGFLEGFFLRDSAMVLEVLGVFLADSFGFFESFGRFEKVLEGLIGFWRVVEGFRRVSEGFGGILQWFLRSWALLKQILLVSRRFRKILDGFWKV